MMQADRPEDDVGDEAEHLRREPTVDERVLADIHGEGDGGEQQQGIDERQAAPAILKKRRGLTCINGPSAGVAYSDST